MSEVTYIIGDMTANRYDIIDGEYERDRVIKGLIEEEGIALGKIRVYEVAKWFLIEPEYKLVEGSDD